MPDSNMHAVDELERRLRRALADTDEIEPRPLASLELPGRMAALLQSDGIGPMRQAAVLAPVLRRPTGLTMLLTRRAETLRNHRGQISFPGGRRDDTDASFADNALREMEEEVGVPRERVEIIGYLDDYPTSSRYLVTPVVGLLEPPERWRPDPAEVAEVFEVPLTLLLDPSRYERRRMLREGMELPYYEINFDRYRIWGATAGMLWNLCQKVQAR